MINWKHSGNTLRVSDKDLPAGLLFILRELNQAGHEAFVVGGSIRDIFLNRTVYDWDVATSATPVEVMDHFERVIETGLQHGTVTVCVGKETYEVTTYRVDVGASDGRRPDSVRFSTSLTEDLERRDFTMNAMAWNPLTGELRDPFGGKLAIDKRLITAVGDAHTRLSEDGLRSLRAARFAAVLGFQVDSSLFRAMGTTLEILKKVSVERIWQEMRKLVLGSNAPEGMKMLHDTGMLSVILPDIKFEQGRPATQFSNDLSVRLADLFIGQNEVFLKTSNQLKLPKKLTADVVHLLSAAERVLASGTMVGSDQYLIVSQIRRPYLPMVKMLVLGRCSVTDRERMFDRFEEFERISSSDRPLRVGELPIDGQWIMARFKLRPSRLVGHLLNHCLEESFKTTQFDQVDFYEAAIEEFLRGNDE